MTYRIGWLSPLTPASGVGTFSHAVAEQMPTTIDGEPIDVTMLYVQHRKLYQSRHRSIQIEESGNFHQVLTLFDLLIYNIGNNREHHDAIFNLLRVHPGIIICHDYVYQHYLADRSLRVGNGFGSYAALLMKYGGKSAEDYILRSRITSRTGRVRYSPWDSECSVLQPMSESILGLGSALIVHSSYAERHVRQSFSGPILRLGMPYDQKRPPVMHDTDAWQRLVVMKRSFHMVSFGYIQPTKCIDLVLTAIATSDTLKRQIRYTIAGYAADTLYLQQLRTIVATYALQDAVTFETDVSDARLADLMSEADIFVNLRKPNTEGSSASLIEQLDAAKPVMVLDSGCYAEVPADAAVKLPPDASSVDMQVALKKLIGRPAQMPVIGQAGRDFARTWSCTSYAETLVQFASMHREVLGRRAQASGFQSPTQRETVSKADEPWSSNLARARASLRYLDCNLLPIDPDIVMTMAREELCSYVAHVIFGLFNDPMLHRALDRFFAGRTGQQAYWACAKFHLVADAVFAGNASARDRLMTMGPCYDPEFWSVVERFPTAYYLVAGSLILARHVSSPEDFAVSDGDEMDGFPRRLRLAEILRQTVPADVAASEQLVQWLEQTSTPDCPLHLPRQDGEVAWIVGGRAFRDNADLAGFYVLEPDHVWSRGVRGFIGLRLGDKIESVKLLVRHFDASAAHPCAVRLAARGGEAVLWLRSAEPAWIELDLPSGTSDETTWLQLSTDRAMRPPNSEDTRMLGVCLLRLHLGALSGRGLNPAYDIAVSGDPEDLIFAS